MIKEIIKNEAFLSLKNTPITYADFQIATKLLDTLKVNNYALGKFL